MTSTRLAALTLAVLLTVAASGGAHAFLDRAEPRVGSTLRAPPSEVRLWFTESLEAAFSSVRVLDANGRRVDKDDGRVDTSNLALLRTSLVPLPPGTYKVVWRVVSIDSHVTAGDFAFHVTR